MMGDERAAADFKREQRYSVVSNYLNRWASVIVFAAIVALAAGAVFVRTTDLAHLRVVIGVSAFDSTRAHAALESFAEFCREKWCGDVRWRYLAPGSAFEGCDLYLVPALAAAPRLAAGSLVCPLLVTEREAHRYSRSAVIVRRGAGALPGEPRVIFSAPGSAAGFLAPYRALEAAGAPPAGGTFSFSGERPRDERTVLAVIHGIYDAGGISLERLAALEASGVVDAGEIEVLFEGEAVPELVIVCDPPRYTAEMRTFARAFRKAFDQAPRLLRRELAAAGMAGLYEAREDDLGRIAALGGLIPPIVEGGAPAGR
jgi:hypothetical protein